MNKAFMTTLCMLVGTVAMVAQNPIISGQFTADPTARVFGDKVYVYPSHDIISPTEPERRWFCMEDYHVFSSSDLCEWTDEGEILNQEAVPWGNPKGFAMWAPDCVENNGTYYFYFPDAPKQGFGFGVGIATAKSPTGPFTPEPNPMAGVRGIDPCVMQTNSGDAYIFWGGGSLSVAKLKPNMLEIEGEPQRINTLPSGFVEGPFAFEHNGHYYLTYPWVRKEGGTETLAYAMSDSPMGPFEYKGLIMEESPTGCWTNHHSIVEYKGQWYLFYHHNDYSPTFDKNRSVCVDSLFFNPDGTIQLVKPTKRGVGISNAHKPIQLDRYSDIGGGAYIEYHDTLRCFDGWKTVMPEAGSWVQYNRVRVENNPQGNKQLVVCYKSDSSTKATINLSATYKATLKLPATGGQWKQLTLKVKDIPSGVYDIKFTANGKIEVDWVKIGS